MSKYSPRRHVIMSPVQALLLGGGKVSPSVVFPWVRFRDDLEYSSGSYLMGITLTEDNATEVLQQLRSSGIEFGPEAMFQISKRLMQKGYAEIM